MRSGTNRSSACPLYVSSSAVTCTGGVQQQVGWASLFVERLKAVARMVLLSRWIAAGGAV